ncbi:histidine phosphatase family protein [Pelomonas sp. UHG3]|uniref:Histidine phosphatase family protein n=1 Tax=Roseateles hydrophilus TaxID=2975054 RepID=A0ACC6CFD6_9BURK|nr:histidine phosphatase family protein [Pelomonas sp. UHG3]MCY4747173.1 histidine phosphatase family protein [Pelomonas sp. UHG3]
MKRLPLLSAVGLLATCLAGTAGAVPDLVIVVRHAEKAAEGGSDPALSPAGEQRAHALAQAVAGLRVNAIVTTQYQRTRATAAPLAQALGLQPQVIETRRGDMPGHVQAVADAVRALTGTVLVVGHSNTVTPLLAALGGPALRELCETSFHHAFVLQPAAAPLRWAQLSYGAPSAAPPEAGCL